MLLLLTLCACLALAAPSTLPVRRAPAPALSPTELAMERLGLVRLDRVVPESLGLRVSLMYARPDNFTGRVLYTDLRHAYLHPRAARALLRAARELQRRRPDLALLVCDAARPMSVQRRMWNVVRGTPQQNYVSNPAHGGGLHNYGLAVDLTLCRRHTGYLLPMGSQVDCLGPLAHVRGEQELLRSGRITPEQYRHRRLLRSVMRHAGFRPLPTEWWHFNLVSRSEARRHYRVIP